MTMMPFSTFTYLFVLLFIRCWILHIYQLCLGTRKLCYRKDDHTMCPIYECPESFLMCIENLKCVALAIPEIIAIGVMVGRVVNHNLAASPSRNCPQAEAETHMVDLYQCDSRLEVLPVYTPCVDL